MNTINVPEPVQEKEDAGTTIKPARVLIGCIICVSGDQLLFGAFVSYFMPLLQEAEFDLWLEASTIISLCLGSILAVTLTQMMTWQWSVYVAYLYFGSVVIVRVFEQLTRIDLNSIVDYFSWPLIYILSVLLSAFLYVLFLKKRSVND